MIGALVADLIKDNCIILPKKIGDVINFGSLGAFVIGGLAGIIIDGSLITAFMGGFMGKEVITALISKNSIIKNDDSDLSGGLNP